jgi:23S rRNA (cytosine1962-C5)-methyltransferase
VAEARVVLQRGREKTARRRHPWLFSGSVARVDGDPQSGDTVRVEAHDGSLLGRAAFSPTSQIRLRMWTYDDAPVDDALIRTRLDDAIARRRAIVLRDDLDCCRLVFAEGDDLPGLVVDRYGDVLVVQCQSAGAERFRDVAVAHLAAALRPTTIYERSDADVRALEGLSPRAGVVHGAPPPAPLVVNEHGLRFAVDVEKGHKTGFYLDQRDARAHVRAQARGRRVLNCFSYTGGFAIAALAGGAASAISVDTSAGALALGAENAARNGFAADVHAWEKGDVFDVLRAYEKEGRTFDLVVLDPPKFAPSQQHLERACRGYKDLNLRALKLLSPGGLLYTFSCSGAMDRALFKGVVATAAWEARRPAKVVGELTHAACHPVALSFPEGEYLKGLVVVV